MAHKKATASDRLELHAHVSSSLQSASYARAVAPLARLILSLPHEHPALGTLWITMAFVQWELGHWSRAEAAARRAVALSPKSAIARALLLRCQTDRTPEGAPCR